MDKRRAPSIEAIFLEIVELPVADRLRALDDRCGDDPALRARVERLLRADDVNHVDAGLELPAVQWPQPQSPSRVGGYVINGIAGEGGAGTVFDAAHESTRRRAAVKLIRSGFATAHGRQRLAIEAETLGRLDHDGVARLYEAGVADVVWPGGASSRMPFIAMEFIENAVSLTQFARQKVLPPRESIRLLAQIARAVHHAHQRGVIHRDLKPGNVLVNEVTGIAKVVDFGIARLTDAGLASVTQTGQVIGTLRYMSPEQANADAKQVDARADIYSLGAILYELLSGRPVIDAPSGSSAAALAQLMTADPPRLASVDRAFKGDLDAIVHKAIEREPDRRYASAAALAEDLERYLDGREVTARAPTLAEQVGRFVKRNKATAAAAAVVLLSLSAGAIAAAWGYVRAERALRDEAQQRSIAEAQTAEAQKQKAEAEKQRVEADKQRVEADGRRDEAEAVTEFFTHDLLGNAVPENISDKAVRDAIVQKLIDPAAALVGEKFTDRPLVEAAVRGSVSTTYRTVGRPDLALPHQQRALEIYRRELGDDDARTINELNSVGHLLHALGRIREAEPYWREAVERRRRLRGDDDPITLQYMNNLGHLLYAQGKNDETEKLWRTVLDRRRATLGRDARDTLNSLNDLSALLSNEGRLNEAAALMQDLVDGRLRAQGEKHPETIIAMGNLASLRENQNNLPEAEALSARTLRSSREVLGEDHPITLTSAHNHASLLRAMGKLDDSESLFREALRRRTALFGDRHPDSMVTMRGLAVLLQQRGMLEEACELMKRSLDGQRVVQGDDHRSTIDTMNALGTILMKLGRLDDAVAIRGEALQRGKTGKAFRRDPQTLRLFATRYAESLDALHRTEEAAAVRKEFGLPPQASTQASTQAAPAPASQPASR